MTTVDRRVEELPAQRKNNFNFTQKQSISMKAQSSHHAPGQSFRPAPQRLQQGKPGILRQRAADSTTRRNGQAALATTVQHHIPEFAHKHQHSHQNSQHQNSQHQNSQHQIQQNQTKDHQGHGDNQQTRRHQSRQHITEELIRKATTMRQHSTEAKEKFFEKITNLSLHGRHIAVISNLDMCKRLRVLFLYNNQIERIENLQAATMLTHLYLENNCIERIENLNHLHHLIKLSLDGNCISRLEGLEGCRSLAELHLSNQRLQPGQTFEIDPASVATLSDSLQMLTISNSNVSSIAPLAGLGNLQTLKASFNTQLSNNLGEVESVLEGCVLLRDVDLSGTPVANYPNYRDTLIARSEYLDMIDGKEVQPNQRAFLQARERRRALGRSLKGHLRSTGNGLIRRNIVSINVVGHNHSNQQSASSFEELPPEPYTATAPNPSAPRFRHVPRPSFGQASGSMSPSRSFASSTESIRLQDSFPGLLNTRSAMVRK